MQITAEQSRKLYAGTYYDKGHTLNLSGKDARYVVGNGSDGFTLSVTKFFSFNPETLAVYLSDRFAETSGYDGIGTWVNEGLVYVDPVNLVHDLYNAFLLATHRKELAIFDTETGNCIDVADLERTFSVNLSSFGF